MAFKSLKKIASILTLATTLSFVSACGTLNNGPEDYPISYDNTNSVPYHPNNSISHHRYIKRKPLKIISQTETKGEVNRLYQHQIKTNMPAKCSLISSPSWMSIQDNELYGYPNHISNSEVGIEKVVVKCTHGNKNAHQSINLQIDPGEYCRTEIMTGLPSCIEYDHVQQINCNADSLEDVVLLCETGFCPDVYKDNNKNAEKAAAGLQAGCEELFYLTGNTGFWDGIFPPVEAHLSSDSTCTNPFFLGESLGNSVCDYTSNWLMMGWTPFNKCLDPNYPEVCEDSAQYKPLNSSDTQGIKLHELEHSMLLFQLYDGPNDENLAYPIGEFISKNQGNKKMSSLCALENLVGVEQEKVAFMHDLCEVYGFDYDDLPQLHTKMRTQFLANLKDKKGDIWISSVTNNQFKKMLDEITGQNTYNVFVVDLCNPNTPILGNPGNPVQGVYCSANLASFAYVDPNYLGN